MLTLHRSSRLLFHFFAIASTTLVGWAQVRTSTAPATTQATQASGFVSPFALGPGPNCPPASTVGCTSGTVQTQTFVVEFPTTNLSPQCPVGSATVPPECQPPTGPGIDTPSIGARFATTDWNSAQVPPNPLVPKLLLPKFNPPAAGCGRLLQAELQFEGAVEGQATVVNSSTLSSCNATLRLETGFQIANGALLTQPCQFNTTLERTVTVQPGAAPQVFELCSKTTQCPDLQATPPQAPLCFTDPAVLANNFIGAPGSTIAFDHSATGNSFHSGCGNSTFTFLNCSRVRARVIYTFCTPTPPAPTPDQVATCRGQSKLINVLLNDTSDTPLNCTPTAGCTTAALEVASAPANGTAVVTTDASCTNSLCNLRCIQYTPNPNFTGVDTFTYRITDSDCCSATTTVTINVCEITAPNVTATVCAGGTVPICLPFTTSAGCPTLTCANVTVGTPTQGTVGAVGTCPVGVTCTTGCCVNYTAPTNPTSSTASFPYTVSSRTGCTATGTVTVNICSLTAPDATATECANGTVDICLPITATAACGTITCSNVTFSAVTGGGTVAASPSCGVTCPAPGCCVRYNATGSTGNTATFTYTVTSPAVAGCTATGTVTVNICRLTAPNATATVCANGTVDICLPITATAACGTITCSNVTFSAVTGGGTVAASPSCGVACPTPGCCVRYNATGSTGNTATFTYTVTSPAVAGCTATGTVTVNICRLTAPNATATVCENGTVDICLPITATAACGTITCSNVTFSAVTGGGTVAASPSCGVTCPAPGCCVRYNATGSTGGTATFTYTVTSPAVAGCTAQGTVTVNICRLTAPNATATVCENGTVDICLPITATSACGTITCSNVTFSAVTGGGTVAASPSCGVTCPAPGCCVRYNATGSTGNTATFTYTVTSPAVAGCTATGTVTVNICRLTAPNATATVCANGTVDICLPITATSACGTITCSNVTFSAVTGGGTVAASPSCGVTCPAPGCCVRYNATGSTGNTATFTYTVTSPAVAGCTAQGTVTVNICRLTAPNATATVCANGTVDICLPITATAACGTITCSNVTFSAVTGGGTVAASPSCGVACPAPGCCVRYNATGSTGNTATFTYTVTSPAVAGCTATGTVTVNICRLTAPNVTATVCGTGTVDICLPITATTACGTITCSNVTLSAVTGGGTVAVSPSCGVACPAPGCCVRYNATGSTGNTATFTYTVTSPAVAGCTAQGTVTVNICRLTTPNQTATVCAGGFVDICLPFTFSGTCGTLTCSNITLGAASQGTLGAVGTCPAQTPCTSGCCVRYTAPATPSGTTATFTYTATAPGIPGCTSTGTVTVNICTLTTPNVTARVCPGGQVPICLPFTFTGSCGTVNCSNVTVGAASQGTVSAPGACPGGTACTTGCCVIYTAPANPTSGTATFPYTVTSGGCQSTGTVTVTICLLNIGPDEAETCPGEPVTIDVVADDSVTGTGCGSIDCHTLVVLTQPPANCGTVSITPGCIAGSPCSSCRLVFTPTGSFVGTCTFTYGVSTSTTPACQGVGTVTVTVNPKPDAVDDVFEFDPTQPDPIELDILANDSPGAPCLFANPPVDCTRPLPCFPTLPQHGTVTFNPVTRLAEYTRGPTFPETGDSFCYRIYNDCGCEDTACVVIRPIEPCPPVNRHDCGSLLLYPEFDNRMGSKTLVTVTDACCGGTGQNVRIEIIFINKSNCLETNRTYVLTPCDTLTFLTSAVGSANTRGYLYLYAKTLTATTGNPLGTPIVFNQLIGMETMINGITSFQYSLNAVSFRGLGDPFALNDDDGDGVRDLNGPNAALPEYERAPDRILIPRFLGQDLPGGSYSSEMVLVNLSGGRQFQTVVDITGYNDNEVPFSGQYQFYCWDKVPLTTLSAMTLNSSLAYLNDPREIVGLSDREAGWMILNGNVAYSSAETILDPAIYAVLIETANGSIAADLPFELCAQENGALLPTGLFGNGPNAQNGDNQ
ncbi:MAG: hypothetical protein IPJ77_13315 [Planctomycetes bacterium]|nr:hypothetical protein [Planctomycetota bacterium]